MKQRPTKTADAAADDYQFRVKQCHSAGDAQTEIVSGLFDDPERQGVVLAGCLADLARVEVREGSVGHTEEQAGLFGARSVEDGELVAVVLCVAGLRPEPVTAAFDDVVSSDIAFEATTVAAATGRPVAEYRDVAQLSGSIVGTQQESSVADDPRSDAGPQSYTEQVL